MRRVRHLLGLAVILGLMSCNGGQQPSDNGDGSAGGNNSGNPTISNPIPFESLTGGAESESLPVPASWSVIARPVEAAPAPTGGQNALLNELLFMPAAGDSQFVEILAAAGGTASSGLTLTTETGDTYVVPDGAPALAGRGLLLIVFDGQNTINGNTVHADRSTFLSSPSGTLHLLDAAGVELDWATWGSAGSEAVVHGLSGDPLDAEEGMTLGRLPHSTRVTPLSWTIYLPEQATPGAPNFNAGVTIQFPLNGTVLNSGEISLSWYPVPDAVSYEVQLAQSATLDTLLLDQTVTEPLVNATLGEGTYYWRVQADFGDGSKADWSLAQTFVLDDGVDLSDEMPAAKSIGTHKGTVPTKKLAVPKISQRKDSNMLLLESMRTDAGHGWDEPHPALDINDAADNMNCALACVQMINHFYHGSVTQDHIGYQLHKDDRLGPERDLNYGKGNIVTKVLGWAVGRASDQPFTMPATYAQFWMDVTQEIDKGRPVIMGERIGNGGHATVIIGYDLRGGKRYLVINDPWNPNSGEARRGLRQYDLIPIRRYYLLGDGPLNGIAEDPRIAPDSEHDGINDFDEEVRFGTSTEITDTDSDCSDDKDEIRNSMFDSAHGWALYWNGAGGDGKARRRIIELNDNDVPISGRPELDSDSDGGGLADCFEDFDGDGQIGAGESDPHNSNDDHRHITGTIDEVTRYEWVSDNPNHDHPLEVYEERHHVVIDLQTDPDTGKLKGTANVQYTNHAYLVYRHPFNCDAGTATQLNIDHPDREWTVQLTGNFYCRVKDGRRIISIGAYGTPDHSAIADYITYHDPCYSDTQPGHSPGTWGGFSRDLARPDGLDERIDYPLPEGPTRGEDSRETHLKIER